MAGNLTDFGIGGAPTSSIVNAYSSGGVSAPGIHAQTTNGGKEVLSGALTATTLTTLLTVTGSGEVPLLMVYTKDTTARTVRIQVIVDGQVTPAFDAVSDSISLANQGIPVIGHFTNTSYFGPSPSPLVFNSSLVVKVASSLSETNKVAMGYVLNKKGG